MSRRFVARRVHHRPLRLSSPGVSRYPVLRAPMGVSIGLSSSPCAPAVATSTPRKSGSARGGRSIDVHGIRRGSVQEIFRVCAQTTKKAFRTMRDRLSRLFPVVIDDTSANRHRGDRPDGRRSNTTAVAVRCELHERPAKTWKQPGHPCADRRAWRGAKTTSTRRKGDEHERPQKQLADRNGACRRNVAGVIARFVRRITPRAKLAFWNASMPHPQSVNR